MKAEQEKLVVSKQRVADHGEVFTPSWLVEAMLDLVKDETERIDSRILEPACGSGNFLVKILQRKLVIVEQKYGKSDFEKQHFALLGLMCIYGIELLSDNIVECRNNLLEIFTEFLGIDEKNEFYKAAFFVLTENLIHGDAITVKKSEGANITFAEWGYLGKGKFQRRDFRLDTLTLSSMFSAEDSLFADLMQFDVIIGNPPYQMKGGAGGTSDSSIYQLFVEQAQKLEPKFLSMVIPSRWLAGGRGLGEFRGQMLSSQNLVKLVDYPVSKEVFPNVEVKGGICYFLWSKENNAHCDVTVIRGKEESSANRQLDEFDVFVRDPRSAQILRKVMGAKEPSITDMLTADTPFGIATNFDEFQNKKCTGNVALYYVKKGKRDIGYMARDQISKNTHLIDKWKVIVPKAGSDGGQKIPDSVLGKPWIAKSPSIVTQSFLAFWADTEKEAKSIQSYYCTKFFRHLVSLRKITQDALRPMYKWVPMQKWDREWTDAMLYEKYGLSDDEIEYIEKVIRPMEPSKPSTD